MDSLGTVDVAIPLGMTQVFVVWTIPIVGISCDQQKYRFQPKDFQITMESGMLWSEN